MEEKLKEMMRNCRKEFLNRADCEQYDVFTTLCLLVPADIEGTDFSLQIICGAGSSEDEEMEPIILFEESTSYTVNDFEDFMKKCSEKYLEQLDVLISPLWLTIYGMDDDITVEDLMWIIDEAVVRKDWSLGLDGLGFRIIDRTL